MRLADAALRAGYRLNTFERLSSTNDEALRRGLAGDRGRLWIVAASQSAGRGRHGRVWASPIGNLMATLLLVDQVPPSRASQLSVVAGVALAEALASSLGTADRLALKWPNDVMADGAKVAGILVEGTWTPNRQFVALVGFGVNCRIHPTDLPYPATDLGVIAGRPVARETVFETLSETMMSALNLWRCGDGFEAVRARWITLAMPTGTPMSVTHNGARVAGTFETMDAQGRLVLATAAGAIAIDGGDVALAERSADCG